PIGQQLVVYGGTVAVPELCSFPTPTFEDETWIYDTECNLWRQVDGPSPGGRNRHMTVYDSAEHRMILFGGRYRSGSSGNYDLFNDLWAFDIASETWSQITAQGTAPMARMVGALVYDPTGHRLILFGGNTSPSGMAYAAQSDLWTFDLSTNTWQALSATGGGPSDRLFASAIWDDSRQRMILTGGADNTAFSNTAKYFDDLWVLDMSDVLPKWMRVDDPSSPHPDGRFWGTLVLDEVRDRYVLFGGHDDAELGNRNDLWAYDPSQASWELIQEGDTWNKPANGFCDFPPDFTNVDYDAPERRNAHVFVAGGDAAWLMAGKTDCGVADDLVRLDLNDHTWDDVTPATVGVSCLRKGGLNCNDLCL
ncbi:MAG: kelch repeat-containing protein, partial [Myxococcota bacterium]|nr:kelch repeat-containing protein [Myxococcota bacterium]